MNTSNSNNASPVFTTYADSPSAHCRCPHGFADDDEDAFTAELVHSTTLDETWSPTHDHHSDDENDDEDRLYSERPPAFRDAAVAFEPRLHSQHAFVETNLFGTNGKSPVFVLDKALHTLSRQSSDELDTLIPRVTKPKAIVASPLSPSSYHAKVAVPEKAHSFFDSVHPSFTSHESPVKIMDTLKTALDKFTSSYQVVDEWTIRARVLLVAEELAFSINLYQLARSSSQYEVEFVLYMGDQVAFVEVTDYIQGLCNDIHDDIYASMSKTLDVWLDDKQDLTGRRYAIKAKEAKSLIQELNCDTLHIETLYEVARTVKNHCRHKGNRQLFLNNDCKKELLKGLQWMLTDTEAVARFALFSLLQFAKDTEECGSFFTTPYEKSSFSLLLDELVAREATCTFTSTMVQAVRQSALFV